MTASALRRLAPLAAILCLGFASSCLSAPDAPGYRYLTPIASEAAPAAGTGGILAVRDVLADEGAREVLAWRVSAARVERRALERWAVRPVDFVRRVALERFEGRSASREVTSLDLELVHFGGAGSAEAPRAEVEIFARAIGGDRSLARTYRAHRPLDAANWRDDLCVALGELTAEVLDAIAADVQP